MSSPTAVQQHKVIIRECQVVVHKTGAAEYREKLFADQRAKSPEHARLVDAILKNQPTHPDDFAVIQITYNAQANDVDWCVELPFPVDQIDTLKEEMVGKIKHGGKRDWIDYSFKLKASLGFFFLTGRIPEDSVLDLSVSDGKDQPCD